MRRFLYGQLLLCTSPDTCDKSIFVGLSKKEPGFRLRDGIQFHLYISNSPCGDARIISLQEKAENDKRKAGGQLRTKRASEGTTIPVSSSGVKQTCDGVSQGKRLLTMSCSDKIARWNVMGIQGESTIEGVGWGEYTIGV